MEKHRLRQTPNLPTVKKIQELAEYRERHRDEWGRPPSLTRACKELGINYKTVRRHAAELLEKWEDDTFRW